MKFLNRNKFFSRYLPMFLSVVLIVAAVFVYLTFHSSTPKAQAGWYSTGGTWLYRKQITVDHTKVSGTASSTQSNFPILVSVTDLDLKFTGSGGKVASSTGADILFTNSDGTTLLNYEIESYASSTGQLISWVKIPVLSAVTDTTIYEYFGNASASAETSGNKTGTWDSNYELVSHYPNGTTLSFTDSTSNNLSPTLSTGVTAVAGQVDGGANFDGTHYIDYNGESAFNNWTTQTVSFWMNEASGGCSSFNRLVEKGANNEWAVICETTGSNDGKVGVQNGASAIVAKSTTSLADSTWHKIDVVINSDYSVILYVDGVSNATAGAQSAPANKTQVVHIGRYGGGTSNNYTGKMDELTISGGASARSADWIKTEYNNQSSPSTFYAYGAFGTQTRQRFITFDAASSGIYTNPGPDLTWNHTVGSSANILVVFVGTYGGSAPAVTYNGSSMTQVGFTCATTSMATLYCNVMYDLINPTTGTHQIKVSDASNYLSGGAWSFGGVDTANPIDATSTNEHTADSQLNATSTITTITNNDFVVAGVMSNDTTQHITGIVGNTWSSDFIPGSPTASLIIAGAHAGSLSAGVQTNVWTTSIAEAYITMAVALRPAGAPAGVALSNRGTSSLGWYNTGGTWLYRKQITVDHTKISQTATTTFSSFPLLVSATDNDLKFTGSGGKVASSTGADILFTDSDGTTLLNYEIESYASTTGQLIAWARIPTLTATSDYTIYEYFGNASAAANTTANKQGTWDSNYVDVYHMAEGSGSTIGDSAASGINLSSVSSTSWAPGSQIGNAFVANGTGDGAGVVSPTTLRVTSDYTVEGWFKVGTYSSSNGTILGQWNNTGWMLYSTGSGSWRVYADANSATFNGAVPNDSAFHYLVGVKSGSNAILYVDGVSQGTTAIGGSTITSSASALNLGVYANATAGGGTGTFDETRLSNAVRSADWIKTEYNNQSSPRTFYTYGFYQTQTRQDASSAPAPAMKVRGGVRLH